MVQEDTPNRKGSKKGSDKGHEVEVRISALAEALGMPSKELASAIAGAACKPVVCSGAENGRGCEHASERI